MRWKIRARLTSVDLQIPEKVHFVPLFQVQLKLVLCPKHPEYATEATYSP